MRIPIYLEAGNKRIFACTLDWPGWCRSGKSEQDAMDALARYAPRYAVVAEEAGTPLPSGAGDSFDVVERLPGSATTDFGAPGAIAAADGRPLSQEEASRLASLVKAAWSTLDRVVASAPAELRKGPRGGGRDRDAVVEHVVSAEFSYARQVGVRHRARPASDVEAVSALRRELIDVLASPSDGTPLREKGWPARYAARRIAWHVLDHAWEIEDRSEF